jgi:hypothetical protein
MCRVPKRKGDVWEEFQPHVAGEKREAAPPPSKEKRRNTWSWDQQLPGLIPITI